MCRALPQAQASKCSTDTRAIFVPLCYTITEHSEVIVGFSGPLGASGSASFEFSDLNKSVTYFYQREGYYKSQGLTL